jgi:hypothetical protein
MPLKRITDKRKFYFMAGYIFFIIINIIILVLGIVLIFRLLRYF